jgi:D-3-phosphoglycerate dehydrogenase
MTRPRILVTEVLGDEALARLGREAEVEAHDLMDPNAYRERLGEFDAVIVRSAHRITARDLEGAPRLRVAARAGTGVDNIDVEAATARGVLVLNTPGANAIAAAEHTWGLLLALCRHVRRADRHVRDGGWDRAAFFGAELRGRRLGIIGIGRVGREVARFGRAFGMALTAYDPYVSDEVFAAAGATRATSLEALLAVSDVLTIHTPKTGPRLGRAELARLPRGAYVLNVARGGLIDERAVAALLEEGHLAGAAFDVFESEPPGRDHPLLEREDTLVTCHLGGSTFEAQERIGVRIAEDVLRALRGEAPEDPVNLPYPPPEVVRAADVLAAGQAVGRLVAALGPPAATLRVTAHGAFPSEALALAGRAVAAGVLVRSGEEGINAINALARAHARGLHLETGQESDGSDDRVLAAAFGAAAPVEVTLPQAGVPRLRSALGARFDLPLGRALLFTRHADRPGVVGRVGTILGEAGANIAALELGRDRPGGDAVMALVLDEALDDAVLTRLAALPDVMSATAVDLADLAATGANGRG